MDIKKKLKEIAKDEARLARQKKKLLDEEKQAKAQDAKLETLFKQSGYSTPRQLVDALIAKYNVKLSGRKPGSSKARRTRTKITPEIRDSVKQEVKSGKSKNAVSKETGISYAVVNKICAGAYDKLK